MPEHGLAVTGGDGEHEGDLVGCTPPHLACLLATQIGIVDLHVANEPIDRVALAHDLHQLLLHQPAVSHFTSS